MTGKSIYILLTLYSTNVLAEFSTDSPLSFGEIAIRNNNSVSTTTISRFGVQNSTNQILVIRSGTPGIYTLSGFPLYTTISLSTDLPVYSAMQYAGSAQFQITAVDMPTSVNTGNTGSTQFRLGATLSTSGNPAETYYSGANYILYLNLNISY